MSVAKTFQVTFDCADPAGLAAFWCEVLGYEVDAPPPGFDSWDAALDAWGVPEANRNDRSACSDPAGVGPRLFFQKVPEGKTAKNRVHLDVRAAPGFAGEERYAALDREYERVLALGATLHERLEPDGMNQLCIVMRDPEGNEFCLD